MKDAYLQKPLAFLQIKEIVGWVNNLTSTCYIVTILKGLKALSTTVNHFLMDNLQKHENSNSFYGLLMKYS